MADVFISYHVSDKTAALVRGVADRLEATGISCWYAPRDTRPGAFVDSILEALEACKLFLLILDEGANGPGYVYNETVAAFNLYKETERPVFLPFQIGTFRVYPKLYFYISPFHILNGGESAESARTDELIKKIAAEFGKTPTKIIKRGECGYNVRGYNVRYELNASGVLTISGAGPMRDFWWDSKNERYNTPWWDEHEMISRARILNGVTYIGNCAFNGCASLASVDIPDSVTYIGDYAFDGCESLASVDLPDSVTYIGAFAFEGCASLASVDIPDSVTSIGDWAFDGCASLASVDIPDSVTYIGVGAFANCASLASVDIPDSVTYIGGGAFYGCKNLKSVSVPAEAKIHYTAFDDTTEVIRRPRK